MLKHILTGQPLSTGSRHHHNDYHMNSDSVHGEHHHHIHNNSLHHDQQPQPQHHHHYIGSSGTRSGGGGGGHRGNNVDMYDSVVQRSTAATSNTHGQVMTPSSAHRHPLNHSQLSVNNLSQRLNHLHAHNLSTLSTSKHSVSSVSPVDGNDKGGNNNNNNSNHINNDISTNQLGHTLISTTISSHQNRPKANGGFDIPRLLRLPSQATSSPTPIVAPIMAGQIVDGPTVIPLNTSWSSSLSRNYRRSQETGVKEMLTSLGLLCLVSLLLALLSVIFLLKISPLTVTSSNMISPEEFVIVYEITLALSALALSLNLCCLLVCAIQFLFAVKLIKNSYQGYRSNKYLQKSSISRACAVGGFFISIPIFLTGMILYTFIQFHSTPAIITSVFIGLGIVFCGCAMVHNVFLWQREKTNAVKTLAREQREAATAQLQQQQQQHLQLENQQSHQQAHLQHQQHQHRHQQQQQYHHHHHHHHQVQSRPPNLSMLHIGSKISGGSCGPNANLSQSARDLHYQHHYHQPHVSMSPPLLLSSPQTSHHNHLMHRGGGVTVTPPTTPGDQSPPSPSGGGKINKSQHLPREISGSVSPGLPTATLDLSSAATTNSPHELSTLV